MIWLLPPYFENIKTKEMAIKREDGWYWVRIKSIPQKASPREYKDGKWLIGWMDNELVINEVRILTPDESVKFSGAISALMKYRGNMSNEDKNEFSNLIHFLLTDDELKKIIC